MKKSRRAQDPITNLETDGREFVCLRVAADFLGLDERTALRRIEEGKLDAIVDGKVYQVTLAGIRDYVARRRRAS